MAQKVITQLVSDISGKEADESEFVKLVIRSHPAVDSPRQLDVLPDELAGFKTADNFIELEVGENGEKRTLIVTYADFKKLVKDEVVTAAPGTRGRRAGYSPQKS